jgi:hypothetical protein
VPVNVVVCSFDAPGFDSGGIEFQADTVVCSYGPRVDSASNTNAYQEYFLGVKAVGALS